MERKGATEMSNYTELNERLQSLIAGVPHPIANLANAAALLWESLPDLNWAGFYLREGEILVLGPFQGKPACIEIPWGRGVCGTGSKRRMTSGSAIWMKPSAPSAPFRI